MKKSLRSILTYGVIALLCVAVLIPGLWRIFNKAPETGTSGSNYLIDPSWGYEKGNPVIAIAHKDGAGYDIDSENLVREAVKLAGGFKKLIKKGSTVVIKPNIVYPDPPGTTVTHWRVVQTVVDMVNELGAGKVYIVEATPLGNNFRAAGYNNIKNAELFDMNVLKAEDCYEIKLDNGYTGQSIWIPKMYMDADVVITIPKMKTHGNTDVTLSLKNAFGVPPTHFYLGPGDVKRKLHDYGISNSIVDINLARKPDFAIIDAITAGEGMGPMNTKFVKSGIVIAGRDIVAADTIAAYYMGYKVSEVKHLVKAGEAGLGVNDLDKIVVKGADLEAIKKKFERPDPVHRQD